MAHQLDGKMPVIRICFGTALPAILIAGFQFLLLLDNETR
jgi:hypothetical protein